MVKMPIACDSSMRFKLKMFRFSIMESGNTQCNKKGVVSMPSTLSKEQNLINYDLIPEAVTASIIHSPKENTLIILANALTKLLPYH
eukprot:CCRYP_004996-RB/>CCRYP_004996-RB protein AED:0.48 eAED:0.56 QI:0/0/0/1/0/0/3/0/86